METQIGEYIFLKRDLYSKLKASIVIAALCHELDGLHHYDYVEGVIPVPLDPGMCACVYNVHLLATIQPLTQ
jgi:hypothetical protein